MSLGQVVRENRKRLGLTQTDLAVQVNRTKQWVSELERDHINVSFEMVRALGDIFGRSLFLLIESKDGGRSAKAAL
jgi:transcriptional regulator with XRE-family HTH domain